MNRKFINKNGQFYELKNNFNLYIDKYDDTYFVNLYIDGKTIILNNSSLKEEEIRKIKNEYEFDLIVFLNELNRSVLTFAESKIDY